MKYVLLLFGLLLALGCTAVKDNMPSDHTGIENDTSHIVQTEDLDVDYFLLSDGTKVTPEEIESVATSNQMFAIVPHVDESGKTNTVAAETMVQENPDGTATLTINFAEPIK